MKEFLSKLIGALTRPAVAIGGTLFLGGLLVGYTLVSTSVQPSGSTVVVRRAPITEEVDVTAIAKASRSTDLAFQVSGRIASIRAAVGDHVYAGQALLALDGANQSAALAGAKANLEVAKAKLDALRAGTRQEQITIDETALAQAGDSLKAAVHAAYIGADDAIHVKTDLIFQNPRTPSAKIAFSIQDLTLADKIETQRISLEPLLASWQQSLETSDTLSSAEGAIRNLNAISAYLDDISLGLTKTLTGGEVSATELATYQNNTNAARTAVTTALSNLTSAVTAYKSAAGSLALAQAGATAQDIAAAQAGVSSAEAAVQAAQVSLSQTVLVAPIAGTITAQNADPGETVSPGVPLVSMIADGKFQAVARVSDADISKIHIGDDVEATFDAYPNTTFKAKVTTVAPAATIENGASAYDVTVTFDGDDPRLSAGLNANLRIITAQASSSLLIPQSALITNGSQTFVYVKEAGQTRKVPVTAGIKGADGMVEILDGLTEGETILAYGSSAQ